MEAGKRGTCCGSSGTPSRTYREICIRITVGGTASETTAAASVASRWATAITRFARGLQLMPHSDPATRTSLHYPDDTPLPSFPSTDVAQLPYTTVKVIISPVSGPGKGPKYWEEVWKDMFKYANVTIDTECK